MDNTGETRANSSTINDGAAAIVVMSEEKAQELGVKIIDENGFRTLIEN